MKGHKPFIWKWTSDDCLEPHWCFPLLQEGVFWLTPFLAWRGVRPPERFAISSWIRITPEQRIYRLSRKRWLSESSAFVVLQSGVSGVPDWNVFFPFRVGVDGKGLTFGIKPPIIIFVFLRGWRPSEFFQTVAARHILKIVESLFADFVTNLQVASIRPPLKSILLYFKQLVSIMLCSVQVCFLFERFNWNI